MQERTKLFIDSEFTNLRQNAQLISLGIVAEDGKSFYAEFTDFQEALASEFVQSHVLPLLELRDQEQGYRQGLATSHWVCKGDTPMIRDLLLNFLAQYEAVECWLDYTAYDWVLFCELFGGSLRLPKQVYFIPFDIATLLKIKGLDPNLDRREFASDQPGFDQNWQRHHALIDAKINKTIWKKLQD